MGQAVAEFVEWIENAENWRITVTYFTRIRSGGFYMMRTGDYPIVDEWTNNIWPEEAKQAIQKFIPDYMNSVVMRTATTNITISFPLKETAQLIICLLYTSPSPRD